MSPGGGGGKEEEEEKTTQRRRRGAHKRLRELLMVCLIFKHLFNWIIWIVFDLLSQN